MSRFILSLSIIVAVGLVAPASVSAQQNLRIGYVNSAKILAEFPDVPCTLHGTGSP